MAIYTNNPEPTVHMCHPDVGSPAAHYIVRGGQRYAPKNGHADILQSESEAARAQGWVPAKRPAELPRAVDRTVPVLPAGAAKWQQLEHAEGRYDGHLTIGAKRYKVENGIVRVPIEHVAAALQAGFLPGPYSDIRLSGGTVSHANGHGQIVTESTPHVPQLNHGFGPRPEHDGRLFVLPCRCGFRAEGVTVSDCQAVARAHIGTERSRLAG